MSKTKIQAKIAVDASVDGSGDILTLIKQMLRNISVDMAKIAKLLENIQGVPSLDPVVAPLELQSSSPLLHSYTDHGLPVIEGLFDGYNMMGVDSKKYPVPLNYASKTKLIAGDALKLKILSDGKFVYKLIRPVERKHCRAVLSKTDDNKFIAVTEDNATYFLNQAAVTFFKGKAGDELYIITNADGSGSFAAIEAILQQ